MIRGTNKFIEIRCPDIMALEAINGAGGASRTELLLYPDMENDIVDDEKGNAYYSAAGQLIDVETTQLIDAVVEDTNNWIAPVFIWWVNDEGDGGIILIEKNVDGRPNYDIYSTGYRSLPLNEGLNLSRQRWSELFKEHYPELHAKIIELGFNF